MAPAPNFEARLTTRQWKRSIRPINEDFYRILVNSVACGPFDGGCLLVARALQRIVGGVIHVTVTADDRADHAAIWLNGKLWDYEGPATPKRFLARFNKIEYRYLDPAFLNVSHRPHRDEDLQNAAANALVEDQVAALFQKILI